MPKLIDNYVLNRKIGAGQYGEVFRGYDRATNLQIAVKSIRRQNVKGKFKQLLESEIKVLKSCQNSHIIKLYDMKKTTNNFYLILQYCNDGDMEAYIKKKKYLVEDQAVEIFCEIVQGFKHLYKHNIFHRDLKLANILRHEGSVKIADFGFAKMMKQEDLAATMLGSPLNMAPQVLQNLQYSNKADIYSLGVCFYWMLFGKPPFNAKNIIELKQIITKQEVSFPKQINSVSEMTQKLIRQMLKPKPNDRIGWQQIFNHPIMNSQQNKINQQMRLTLTMEGSFTDNISKLYLNQNLVIIHPVQFKKKQEVVSYACDALKEGKKKQFTGQAIKKNFKEVEQNLKVKRDEIKEDDKLNEKETEDEKILNSVKSNTFYLLNQRNCIIFIISVLNSLRVKTNRKLVGELAGQLIKKVQRLFQQLSEAIIQKINHYKLPYWDSFIQSSAYKNLEHFLVKEKAIVEFQLKESQKVAKKCNENYDSLVKNYAIMMMDTFKKDQYDQKLRGQVIQLNHLLDIIKLDQLLNEDFDFKHYYNDYGKLEMKELVESLKERLKKI